MYISTKETMGDRILFSFIKKPDLFSCMTDLKLINPAEDCGSQLYG
jgi:hypothetical protein